MVPKWKLAAMTLSSTLFFCLTCGCAAIAAALAGLGFVVTTPVG